MDFSSVHVVVLSFLLGVATVVYGQIPSTQAPSGGGDHNTAFQNAEITRDTQHIKEHLSEKINQDQINKMSPEELEFQFFVAHDLNQDGQLDGLEIFKSLEHAVEHMEDAKYLVHNQAAATERVTGLTDDVLAWQDMNKDGYLDYREYTLGHRAARKQAQGQPPKHTEH